MPTWAYELNVPDDMSEFELAGYRELAISTWRTGAECMGGRPGDEPDAALVEIEPVDGVDMGVPVTFRRAWRIVGPVS